MKQVGLHDHNLDHGRQDAPYLFNVQCHSSQGHVFVHR